MTTRALPAIALFVALLGASSPAARAAEDAEGWTWRSPLQRSVLVNQVGYLPKWPKSALLHSASRVSGSFEVLTVPEAEVAFVGEIGPARPDPWTGGWLADLDFTALRLAGTYRVRVEGAMSPEVEIGRDKLQHALRSLLRSYYLQRCGMAIEDPETGMSRPACHLGDGARPRDDAGGKEGSVVEATGGWHDAGDYGKYVAPASVAVAQLLALYERYPERFTDGQLAIPESGNDVPDLLDELRYKVDWLLRMQRDDGAVYRKLSGARWPHNKTPSEDDQQRYVYGVTTPETGKFVATAAMASRVFADIDSDYSQELLVAALRGWVYLDGIPRMYVDWEKADDGGSGKYLRSDIDNEPALNRDRDDRAWAAAELFVTTGDPQYEAVFRRLMTRESLELFEWKNALMLGVEHYVRSGRGDPRYTAQLQRRILRRARRVARFSSASAYGLANRRFIWGSNKMAAQEGFHLLTAYAIEPSEELLTAATRQLDFLLGRNPFRMSFVTGVGERSVQNVVHIYGTKAGLKIPGLMVGGPNSGAQAGIAPKGLGLLSYADHNKSYATNEYAIDYNSALIGLLVELLEVEVR